jgi:hypothetical protein
MMHRHDPRIGIILCPSIESANGPGYRRLRPRGEKRTRSLEKRARNGDYLRGGLAFAQHDFRETLPQSAMVIERREPKILEGHRAQSPQCAVHRDMPPAHLS